MLLTSQLAKWLSTEYNDMPKLRRQLLDAAAQAFTNYGYKAASIDLIAKKLDVTKGSVYYYYKNKAELFYAVHERAMNINLKAIAPIALNTSVSASERLYQMSHRHVLIMMNEFYYQRVTVQGVEQHQLQSSTKAERIALKNLIDMRDAYEKLFVQVIQDCLENKSNQTIDPGLAAKSILGSLNWVTVWYRPQKEEQSVFKEKVADQLARQAVASIKI